MPALRSMVPPVKPALPHGQPSSEDWLNKYKMLAYAQDSSAS